MTQERFNEIIELIHKEVVPALGCTEPIAEALAVAKAVEILRENGYDTDTIEVEVSANILKNGMGVGIPGTGMVGLHIAAALAITCGKSEYKLEVLKDLDKESIERAKAFVDAGKVRIKLADTDIKLFISAICRHGEHYSKCIVQDNHDSIVYTEYDGKILSDTLNAQDQNGCQESVKEKTTLDYKLNLKEIWDFANEVPLEQIEFIMEAAKLNTTLSNEGLKNNYGLRVGKTIADSSLNNIYGNGLLRRAMSMTAAASDARMAGCTLPAMSNSGSGNQGITATMPVVAAAQEMNASHEQLCRALALSHLVAIHIKGYLGKLSALCGCVVASTGSSCGIVRLHGGSCEQVSYAIKNMLGNISGMFCDGAKEGCALKVASGVSASVQSAMLALNNICISGNDGIIEKDVEKTIRNIGQIGAQGMLYTDKMILNIMIDKK